MKTTHITQSQNFGCVQKLNTQKLDTSWKLIFHEIIRYARYLGTCSSSIFVQSRLHSLPLLVHVYWNPSYPAENYMCKVSDRNPRARCEICSKLTNNKDMILRIKLLNSNNKDIIRYTPNINTSLNCGGSILGELLSYSFFKWCQSVAKLCIAKVFPTQINEADNSSSSEIIIIFMLQQFHAFLNSFVTARSKTLLCDSVLLKDLNPIHVRNKNLLKITKG